MEEYALASAEASYENPGEQSPIVLMALGVEIQGLLNTPTWVDRKHSSFPSQNGADNTRWETAAV